MVSKKTMEVNPKHSIMSELKKGLCGQVGQDCEGPDLASLRHILAHLWLQPGRAHAVRRAHPPHDQAWLEHRRWRKLTELLSRLPCKTSSVALHATSASKPAAEKAYSAYSKDVSLA